MKHITFIIACCIAVSATWQVKAQLSFGQSELINQQWQFRLGEDANTEWQNVRLPHDWSVKQSMSPDRASCTGFLPGGIGEYRKTLFIPQEKQGKRIYLYFEGVYNRSEVKVNDIVVGSRPNGYISFAFDITAAVQFGQNNEIKVRVDHSQDADSRWYTGSGIYRNVWLITANPLHIAQWGVFAYPKNVSTKSASLVIETELINDDQPNQTVVVRNELLDNNGKIVAQNEKKISFGKEQTQRAVATLTVKNPRLWDLEHPNLYTLKTTVSKNGKTIDQTTTQTGFRQFTFDSDKGFSLNGKNLKIKGVCIHHDAGVLGSAVPKEVWERRLQALKEIGVNGIRTSHNPQAPDLYDLCDAMGFLVLNEAYDEWEFPKNKWITGWNVGKPGHQGMYDIFADWGEQDLADMVRRDRNHLSVFAWSIGNEVDYPNDPYSHPILDGENTGFTQKMFGGYKPDAPNANRLGDIAKRLVAAVKQYDTTRPVTAGLAGVAMSNETEYPDALDIQGYNYTESRYASDHEKYPKRVLFGSETRHDLPAWKSVTDNEFIFGQFIWTGIDYLGESGRYPTRGFYSGLVDFGGFIKPRGYFRKALWSEKPSIYIGTYQAWGGNNNRRQMQPSMDAWSIWNYEAGQNVNVVCYTNAAKAQLFLNGKAIAEKKDYDPATGIIAWNIPYQAGLLEAVGYDADNKEMARYSIRTSKQPYAIKAEVYPSADNDKIKQVIVQIVDEDGTPVILADNEITCWLTGNAQLLGLEAGNNNDTSNMNDNRQRVYMGRMIAYVQTDGNARLTLSSQWLKSAEVNF
ncbi:MAG: DUF4982 domain-containing protein [Candidatus Symbiothrix sp.]|nr:DUF4982 domain-containing protein [Candidatus Symbiothrix sp.]